MQGGTLVTGQVTGAEDGGGQAGVAGWNVPGYTGLRALGSGGFGDVVLARHDESGTLVAIKFLRRELLADARFAEMFRAEAAVLASLDDPHVVRLYEYAESPSGAAIVMELVDGVSLRAILARQGGTSPEAALVVLQGSLLGLAAAHGRGVVHRDYKPDNVLVDGDGASKLTDFGIAARSGERAVRSGTLAYAPPEQFAGAPASPAGDVYAATATFFECLTGRPPFAGDTAEALLAQHVSQPVPVAAVPGPVRPLVAAGMAKQPQDRPADAARFVAALNAVAAGAYGPDWERRGRSHLGEAALLLAALWPSGAPPAVQGSTVEAIPLRRRRWGSRLGYSGAVKAAIAAAIAVVVAAAGTVLAVALTGSGRSHPVTPPSFPAVTGVSPASGSTAGGTTVSITGTGLAGATAVRFGGTVAAITADSSTQITVTTPAGTGTVTITVTTPAGTSKTTAVGHYTYAARPELAQSISFTAPASGTAGGSAALSATGGASGNPVVFSADSSSGLGVCTVSGATVTYTGAGSCVIDANQAGNGTYAAAPQVQQTITVIAPPNPIPTPKPTNPQTTPTNPQATPTNPRATPTNPRATPTNPQATPTPTGPPPAGATWTAAEGSLPNGAESGGLGAVTCPSTSACVATGGYTDSSGDSQVMLETGLGSSWTDAMVTLPAGGSAPPNLAGVACPSTTQCVAVGEFTDSSGHNQLIAVTGYGSSWTTTELPLPANAGATTNPELGGRLSSVACASTTQCTAVGTYTDSSGNQQALLVTGYGSSWTATEAPLPGGTSAGSAELLAVTCPSSQCVAVGDYNDDSGEYGLLLTGSGSSWTALQEPGQILSAVTCPSATECVAVGGAIVTGYGSSWTATITPPPPGVSGSNLSAVLTAVTCTSVSSCVAVGSSLASSSSNEELPLLVTGSGSSWTAVNAPLPAGASSSPYTALNSVSCPAASACVVVGTYADANGNGQVLLMFGSGSSWSADEGPLPGNAMPTSSTSMGLIGPPQVGQLTCLSTSSCVAFGSYADTASQTEPLLLSGPDTGG